jgi:coenzyme Q-binding protein COQ10
MLKQKAERVLRPYRPEDLFDLAADVERYPEFLPWWIAARIRARAGSVYTTDQILGLGPLRVRFGSKTVLDRPTRIDVTSDDAPFRRFALVWTFAPVAKDGCRVSLSAELELNSLLLERVVERILPKIVADIMAAFDVRAHDLAE